MRILIAGEVYSNNLGDRVIYDCIDAALKVVVPGAKISPYGLATRQAGKDRIPTESRRLNGVGKIISKTRRRVPIFHQFLLQAKMLIQIPREIERAREAVRGASCIFIGGGQLLLDNGRFPATIYALCREAQRFNVPVIFYGVGAGQMWSRLTRTVIGQALDKGTVKRIVFRDKNSIERAKKLWPRSAHKFDLGEDPAFSCGSVYSVAGGKEKGSFVGLNIIGCNTVWRSAPGNILADHKSAKSLYKSLIKKILEAGKGVLIFTNGSEEDKRFSKEIYSSFEDDSLQEQVQISLPNNAAELVETVAQCQTVIAARLHANIIATAVGVPSIALVWDDKVRAIATENSETMTALEGSFSAEQIFTALDNSCAEREPKQGTFEHLCGSLRRVLAGVEQ